MARSVFFFIGSSLLFLFLFCFTIDFETGGPVYFRFDQNNLAETPYSCDFGPIS